MSKGKEKCEILKAIRTYVADKYGVEYSPTECTHEGECRGTCPKCDAELAELQESLEAKGIFDISEDAKLNDLVRNYLNQDNNSIPIPGEDSERTEGMPMPLQGDIAVVEEGQVPDQPHGGDMSKTTPNEDKKLFMECSIAGISFYDIDDIWNELQIGTKLALVRQKDNAYDKNAVAVALVGDYDGDPDDFDFDFILGYIPRKCNEALAVMLDMGWQDMFETEICELKEHVPYSDRIHISIYIKNRESTEEELEEKEGNRLRMVVITEEDKWRHLSEQLWQKGYTYFRWGGFPPWELDLPSKGDKVVFLYHDGERYFMYLMQTIAIGEQSIPFLEDVNELYQVDDCTVYVLSNVVGPIAMENNELKLPRELLKGKYQPDERVSQSLSDKLMNIFIGHQYS